MGTSTDKMTTKMDTLTKKTTKKQGTSTKKTTKKPGISTKKTTEEPGTLSEKPTTELGLSTKTIISQRGNKLLIFDNDKYRRYGIRKSDGLLKWRCSSDKRCSVILYTENDVVMDKTGKHTHVQNEVLAKILKQELRENCKRRADEITIYKAPKIIEVELSKIKLLGTIEEKTLLINSLKKAMYCRRSGSMPRPPETLEETLQLARHLTTNEKFMFEGQPFIFVPQNKHNIICLTTAENVSFLCKNYTEIFAQSSHRYAPKNFEIVYILYGMKNKTCIPLVYFLLAKLTQDTLKDMWEYLKQLCAQLSTDGTLNFKYLHIDLENTVIEKTINISFPGVKVLGRKFSFEKDWKSKIQISKKLKKAFLKKDEMAKWLKQFFAMSFLPWYEVEEAFVALMSVCPKQKTGFIFSNYILKEYVEEGCFTPPRIWAQEPFMTLNNADGPDIFTCNLTRFSPISSFIVALLQKQRDTEIIKRSILNSNQKVNNEFAKTNENLQAIVNAFTIYTTNKTQSTLLHYLNIVSNIIMK